jgi:hypothetical protein
MSTFYVMPSRPLLGRLFGEFLTSLFPGLDWNTDDFPDLGEALGAAARIQPEVYVLFREDLACERDAAMCLVRDFGAEAGDQIIEVEAGEEGPSVRYWQVGWRAAA